MQNAQSADIQGVINLVELYRTKAGKESDRAKEAIMEYEDWSEYGVDQTQANDDAQWEWVNVLSVNEQLLGHFYSVVAGENAEKDILHQLLPDFYDATIFTQEEECFLVGHFREMVNYIIQTSDNGKEAYLIPEEVLDVIKSRVNIPKDAIIYNPFAGLGQLATLFKSNTVLLGNDGNLYDHLLALYGSGRESDAIYYQRMLVWLKSWAWARIAMYANNVNACYMKRDESSNYDVLIAHLPSIQKRFYGEEEVKRIYTAYCHLKEGGKMVLLCPNNLLWKDFSIASLFREQLIKDGSIAEIIQLPSVVRFGDFCIIIAEKGRRKGLTTFINAQDAFKKKTKLSTKDYIYHVYGTLDMEKWNALLINEGIELETGLRKIAQLESVSLNPNMLLPQVCVLERPSESENPNSLSKLCNLETKCIRNVEYDLPIDTPWVEHHNISRVFQGALDITLIKKADCPNIPPHTEEYEFNESGEFIDWSNNLLVQNGQKTEKGKRVVDYRRCTFIDGTKDAVLFKQQGDEVSVALIRATGKPVAIDPGINVFIPNDDIDALSLVALLKLPIVYRQIRAYDKFGLSNYMDDILVPTDLRIIRDEERRLKDEQETYKAQQEKFESMKTEYINEVRMRKHDMRPHMKQLNSAKNLMQYYVENMDSISGVQELLNNQIRRFSSALDYLSDLVEHFSDEEQFGEPEKFNLHAFLSHIGERHGTEEYVIKYDCDMKSIKEYNIHRQKEIDNYMINQAIEDAIAQQEMDDYLINQEIEDAIAQQEMDDYLINQEIEDAIAQQEMNDSFEGDEAYVFEETQVNDEEPYVAGESQVVDDETYVFEETQVNSDEPYVAGESQVVDDETYVFEETQVNDDEPCMVDDTQVVDSGAYVMDGLWKKYLTSIPQAYMAPNDIQRLVNNILDNARKHGFTDSERNDYEVDVKLSTDTKRNMFQIDFRNNGNPLPNGMDKMRYGLLGEKAGKTGGTGIGGNYVKKFVEHYGGDYDIFMEDGWVVIRIYLPIK